MRPRFLARLRQGAGLVAGKRGNCRHYQGQFHAYRLNQLSPPARRRLQHHLANCARCARHFDEDASLDAALRSQAARYRPRLSPAASARVQQHVYRKMRRALLLQRAWVAVERLAGAALVVLVFAAALAYSGQVSRYLSPPSREGGALSQRLAVPGEAIRPPAPPAPAGALPAGPGRAPSLAAGSQPEEGARRVLLAALAGDEAALAGYFAYAGSAVPDVVRLWRPVRQCGQALDPARLAFHRFPAAGSRSVRVDVSLDGRLIGDFKMRQESDGWHLFFMRYALIAALGRCRSS